jgi:hypothetical protein
MQIVILSLVLCGSEIWFIFRNMLVNILLKIIFGPKWQEIRGCILCSVLIDPFFTYFYADQTEGVPDKNTRAETMILLRIFKDLLKIKKQFE